jgi:hypothetical protein
MTLPSSLYMVLRFWRAAWVGSLVDTIRANLPSGLVR